MSAEVADLQARLAELAEVDHVGYPPLTRDELLSLGDRPAFADRADLTWWGGLDERTRAEVRATAQRGLLARCLASIDRDEPTALVVDDRLALVLAVRTMPAFVTVAGNAASGDPMLRCYGVLDAGGSLAAVLLEARLLPGVSEFVLGTPHYAATALTRLLYAPPDQSDPAATSADHPAGGVLVRRMEMFPPGITSGGRRYLIMAAATAGALATVDAAGRPGPLTEITEQAVVDLVLSGWSDDAARAAAPA